MSAPRQPAPPAWFATFVPGRRGELLDAALAVFGRKGYAAGTMREIAAEVGVTEPALYRYWPGKERLFAELIELAGDFVVSQASSTLRSASPDTLMPALRALLAEVHDESARRRFALMRAVIAAAPNEPAFAAAFREHVAYRIHAALTTVAERLDAQLGIERSAEQRSECVRVVMSLFVGYSLTTLMLADTGHEERVAVEIVRIMGWAEVLDR